MQEQQPHYFVYIFGEKPGAEVQIGVVSNLQRHVARIREQDTAHPVSYAPKLVYYEHYDVEEIALNRERQIKSADSHSTNSLIASMNPNWLDLSDTL